MRKGRKHPAANLDTRFPIALNYAMRFAFLIHVLFSLLFMVLGATWLALFNVGSVALYILLLWLLRRGQINLTVGLAVVEVISHAFLAVYTLGWASGFQSYILVLAPIIIQNPHWALKVRVPFVLVTVLLYGVLGYLAQGWTPLLSLSPQVLHWLGFGNIFGLFSVFTLESYYYSWSTTQTGKELVRANEALAPLATTDPLTGLLNRRSMLEIIRYEKNRSIRNEQPFAILLADVDNFKQFNDEHGHACGDFVLSALAGHIEGLLRGSDRLARWGGEEFLFILPETDLVGAQKAAEKIRRRVAESVLEFEDEQLTVSMTFGVALCGLQDAVDDCIQRADFALFEGKRQGKNRVALANIDHSCQTFAERQPDSICRI